MTTGRGVRHGQTNASRTDEAHIFQMWLRPSEACLDPRQEQKRFSAAYRRGELCMVASPDGRKGSLRVHQDALIYSALLEPGKHVVHELTPGRTAWLQVIKGEVLLEDVILSPGDGVGIALEQAVSLTAAETSEILLLDLGSGVPEHQPFPVMSPKENAAGLITPIEGLRKIRLLSPVVVSANDSGEPIIPVGGPIIVKAAGLRSVGLDVSRRHH